MFSPVCSWAWWSEPAEPVAPPRRLVDRRDLHRLRPLRLDRYALPEGNVASDGLSGGEWIGVVPGGILVRLAVHYHVVIAGLAFPGTCGVRTAGAEIFLPDGLRREVVVALHHNCLLALGDHGPIPDSLRHGPLLTVCASAILRRYADSSL